MEEVLGEGGGLDLDGICAGMERKQDVFSEERLTIDDEESCYGAAESEAEEEVPQLGAPARDEEGLGPLVQVREHQLDLVYQTLAELAVCQMLQRRQPVHQQMHMRDQQRADEHQEHPRNHHRRKHLSLL